MPKLGQKEYLGLTDDELFQLVDEHYQNFQQDESLQQKLIEKGYDLERIMKFSQAQRRDLASRELRDLSEAEILAQGSKLAADLSKSEFEATINRRDKQLSREELIALGQEHASHDIEQQALETYELFEEKNNEIVANEYENFKAELANQARVENLKLSKGEITLAADKFYTWLKADTSWQSLLKEPDKDLLQAVFRTSFKDWLKDHKKELIFGGLSLLAYSGLSAGEAEDLPTADDIVPEPLAETDVIAQSETGPVERVTPKSIESDITQPNSTPLAEVEITRPLTAREK